MPNPYGFRVDPKLSLKKQAAEAVSRIYGAGVGIAVDSIAPKAGKPMPRLPAPAFYSEEFGRLSREANVKFHITPGGNNVMARCAAAAFSPEQLDALAADPDPAARKFADIINLRREYDALTPENGADEYLAHADKLQAIYDAVGELEAGGWKPSMRPAVWAGPRFV